MMASLLGRLEAEESAVRARLESLRAEMAALAERLAEQEEVLSRLVIMRETVLAVLGEGDDRAESAAGEARVGGMGPVAAVTASPAVRAVVALAREGAVDQLPPVYREVVRAVAVAGGPQRAKQICQTLGLGTEPQKVEPMRGRLKRLVRRGWPTEQSAGVFALAEGVIGSGGQGGQQAGSSS